MLQNLRKLLVISRPVSWLNTAFPFATGYLLVGGELDAALVIGTVFFLIPYNLLMYGINDVFDYESDIANPRKGSIEGAMEQKSFHPTILWCSMLVCLPFVGYLLAVGTLLSNTVLIGVLFFVVAYSAKYLRFKEIPVLDSITSSIHFAGPLVFALTLTSFAPAAWPYVIAFFLWSMASHALGAIQDIVPDRHGNIHSIATVFGARITLYSVLFLYAAAICLVALQGSAGDILIASAGLLYILNIAPFYAITDATSGTINAAWRRFIWLNMFVGFVVTMVLILSYQP